MFISKREKFPLAFSLLDHLRAPSDWRAENAWMDARARRASDTGLQMETFGLDPYGGAVNLS